MTGTPNAMRPPYGWPGMGRVVDQADGHAHLRCPISGPVGHSGHDGDRFTLRPLDPRVGGRGGTRTLTLLRATAPKAAASAVSPLARGSAYRELRGLLERG